MKIDSATPAASASTAHSSQRIHDAAEKFEAVLLGQMLKPLAQKEDDSQNEGSVMQGYGVEALADTLARQGGLGFARLMELRFEKSKNLSSQP